MRQFFPARRPPAWARRHSPIRPGFIAGLAVAAALGLPAEARAACAPNSPVNNADVACTSTTVNQNGLSGYGTVTDTGKLLPLCPTPA